MLTPAPHIHWGRCYGGGIAVLDLKRGTWEMFHGNEALIWDAITLRGSTDGLAEEIAIPAGYDVAATRAAIASYLEGLRGMGLLVSPEAPRPRRRWRWFR
ncbi:hypothetical protein [Streptomyces sp. NPDC093707]|uniref:hypothetical protein n=1 Tax=Streptomyces sp. NPDC093707 TaxID=3154984 RepID=UPI00344E0EC4